MRRLVVAGPGGVDAYGWLHGRQRMSAPASGRGGAVAGVILAAGSSSRLGTPKQLLRYRGETLLHRTVRLAIAAGLDPVHVVLGSDASAVGAALEELRGRVTTVFNPDWQAGMGNSLACGIASLPAGTGPAPDTDPGPAPGVDRGTAAGPGAETCPSAVDSPVPSAGAASRSAPGARPVCAAVSCAESGSSAETGSDDADAGHVPAAASPEPSARAATNSKPGGGAQSGPESGAGATTEPGAALVLVTDQPRLSHAVLADIAAAYRTGGVALVASRYASGAVGVPALFARRYFPELTRLTGDRGARALFARHRGQLVTVAFPAGDLDIDTPGAAAATLEPE